MRNCYKPNQHAGNVTAGDRATPKRSTEIDAHVGARLRQLRKARGMTQADVARGLGISFAQLQKYESGGNRVSAARLYQVARIFDVRITHFFEGLR